MLLNSHYKQVTMAAQTETYSSKEEANRIFQYLLGVFDPISLPPEVASRRGKIRFTAERDLPYFPIPFKETETAAALKAIEGTVAALLAETSDDGSAKDAQVRVSLEKTTAFLFQAYLARVGGLGKLDKEVKALLKGRQFAEMLHRGSHHSQVQK